MIDAQQQHKLKNIAVVIPALNEANDITAVVAGVALFGMPIVVDDGSNDDTAILAELAGALVVKHRANRGYDAALESGLFKAIELGFEFAVTLDADGQHLPETLLAFKAELVGGADLVVGFRDQHQRYSETVFSAVSKTLWGVIDPLCGMKGYKLSHLAKLGHFDSYNSIGTEFTLRCVRAGLNIKNVTVPTRRRSGKTRFGSGTIANLKIFRALLIGLINKKNYEI
jgi:glycosyltransferase involved in cell wall biosynthesis